MISGINAYKKLKYSASYTARPIEESTESSLNLEHKDFAEEKNRVVCTELVEEYNQHNQNETTPKRNIRQQYFSKLDVQAYSNRIDIYL